MSLPSTSQYTDFHGQGRTRKILYWIEGYMPWTMIPSWHCWEYTYNILEALRAFHLKKIFSRDLLTSEDVCSKTICTLIPKLCKTSFFVCFSSQLCCLLSTSGRISFMIIFLTFIQLWWTLMYTIIFLELKKDDFYRAYSCLLKFWYETKRWGWWRALSTQTLTMIKRYFLWQCICYGQTVIWDCTGPQRLRLLLTLFWAQSGRQLFFLKIFFVFFSPI